MLISLSHIAAKLLKCKISWEMLFFESPFIIFSRDLVPFFFDKGSKYTTMYWISVALYAPFCLITVEYLLIYVLKKSGALYFGFNQSKYFNSTCGAP